MIAFLDASAMVAIMMAEAGASALEERCGEAEEILCSALSLWEAARAAARKRTLPMSIVRSDIDAFVTDFSLRLVPIGNAEVGIAIAAHERYGKGTGHPARLNMGDCFAYACAKANNAVLLYKGHDFSKTDLA